jgi:protein-disulfide isomerase
MSLVVLINDRDHIQGNANASTTLVEYGDFECPHCGAAYPVIKEVQKRQGDKLRFVFRNFPISQAHPHAAHTAYAAEAAGKQGKYWEMHDMIFENQNALEDENLVSYAQRLNLNIDQFKIDMSSKEIAQKVSDDFTSGVRSGVNGTPTIYINGKRFDEECEVDLIIKAIEGGEYQ